MALSLLGTSLVPEPERRKWSLAQLSHLSHLSHLSSLSPPRVSDSQLERWRRHANGASFFAHAGSSALGAGSEEGWEPRMAFRSSRDRSARQDRGGKQRPEDFMDEEDKEFMRGRLQATVMYDSLGERARESARKSTQSAQIPTVEPVFESFGKRIMQVFGWRQGQGLGPRRRVGLAGKTVRADGTEVVDEYAAGRTFAAQNVKLFEPRVNLGNFGFGFMPKVGQDYADSSLLNRGIGVSVLENDFEEGLDVDIYGDGRFESSQEARFSSSKLKQITCRLEEGQNRDRLLTKGDPFAGYLVATNMEILGPRKCKSYPTFNVEDVFPLSSGDSSVLMPPKDSSVACGTTTDDEAANPLLARFSKASSSKDESQPLGESEGNEWKKIQPVRREVFWAPEKLVCKRFGLSVPKTLEKLQKQDSTTTSKSRHKEATEFLFENVTEQDLVPREAPSVELLKSIFEPEQPTMELQSQLTQEKSKRSDDNDVGYEDSQRDPPPRVMFKSRSERKSSSNKADVSFKTNSSIALVTPIPLPDMKEDKNEYEDEDEKDGDWMVSNTEHGRKRDRSEGRSRKDKREKKRERREKKDRKHKKSRH